MQQLHAPLATPWPIRARSFGFMFTFPYFNDFLGLANVQGSDCVFC